MNNLLKLTLLTLLSVIILSCKESSSNKDLTNITIGYRPTVAVDLAMIKAIDKKQYKEKGFNVKLKPYANALMLFTALQNGEIQGSAGIPLELVLAKVNPDGTYPVKGHILWYFDSKTQYDGFVVRKNSNIKEVSDLKGKLIASHPSKQVTQFVKDMAPGSSVQPYNPSSPLFSLKNKDVSAVYVLEPFLSLANTSKDYRVIEYGSISKRLFKSNRIPAAVSCVSTKWAQENPSASKKFIKVSQDFFSQRTLSNQEKQALLEKEAFGGFAPQTASIISEPSASLPKDLDKSAMQMFTDYLKTKNLLKAPVKLDELLVQ